MISALRRFFGPSWQGRRLLAVEFGLGLALVRVLLATAGYRRCQGVLQGLAGSRKVLPVATEIATSRAVAVERAFARRRLLRTTCLARALTLWWLLLRAGIATRIRFGGRHDEKGFEGHAWVERIDGEVVDDMNTPEGIEPFPVAGGSR